MPHVRWKHRGEQSKPDKSQMMKPPCCTNKSKHVLVRLSLGIYLPIHAASRTTRASSACPCTNTRACSGPAPRLPRQAVLNGAAPSTLRGVRRNACAKHADEAGSEGAGRRRTALSTRIDARVCDRQGVSAERPATTGDHAASAKQRQGRRGTRNRRPASRRPCLWVAPDVFAVRR